MEPPKLQTETRNRFKKEQCIDEADLVPAAEVNGSVTTGQIRSRPSVWGAWSIT